MQNLRRATSEGVTDHDFAPELSVLPECLEFEFDSKESAKTTHNSYDGSLGPRQSFLMQIKGKLSMLRKGMGEQLPVGTLAEPQVTLGSGVIIFDWDDTLMPTSYLKHIVIPTMVPPTKPVLPESPYYNDLLAHACAVEELLRAANKVATIAIVTLATKWWVQTSAERYLPGLDFESIMSELDIAIYPADRQSAMVRALTLSGRDPGKVAKKVAMSKCLKQVYTGTNLQWNALSVGDSAVEREALKECLMSNAKKTPICKTIKIRENLRAAELTKELEQLTPHLKSLVAHTEDFERTVCGLPSKKKNASRLFI
jgi:hypothetical protein